MIDDVDKESGFEIISQETKRLMEQSRNELGKLHRRVNGSQGWLNMFLVSFVLLHNLESIIKRERSLARLLHAPVSLSSTLFP